MNKSGQKKTATKRFITLSLLTVAIISIITAVFNLLTMVVFSTQLTRIFGSTESSRTGQNYLLDLKYHPSDYLTDSARDLYGENLRAEIQTESIVLLENENLLPLPFGASLDVYGSGQNIADGKPEMKNVCDALTNAGYRTNNELRNFYENRSNNFDGAFNEMPLDLLTNGVIFGEEKIKDSVAIYVITRPALKSGDALTDLPSVMQSAYNPNDKNKNYLEPSTAELETLEFLNKRYEKILLVINSANPIELTGIEKFTAIKGIILQAQVGKQGFTQLANVVCGKEFPSGRLVDTWAYDNFSAPSAENFGEFEFYRNSARTEYFYTSHAEGLYVGYRYYETRYFDVVTGKANVGEYYYKDEVKYPFGYGKTYAEFLPHGMSMDKYENGLTFRLRIRNIDEHFSGKETYGLYVCAPYTERAKTEGIERASVTLCGFVKTDKLSPGQEEYVSVTAPYTCLEAYSTAEGGFLTEAGKYYFTFARDAHEATNNVLARMYGEGESVDVTKMVGVGNPELTLSYEVHQTTVRKTDETSGEEIDNLFTGNAPEKRLTRKDWVGSYPTPDGEIVSESIYGKPDEDGVAYIRRKEVGTVSYARLRSNNAGGEAEGLTGYAYKNSDSEIIDVRGLPIESEKWLDLLNNLSRSNISGMITMAGYGSEHIAEINKPKIVENGNAYGINVNDPVCAPIVLAQTWNENLALKLGEYNGNVGLRDKINGWYAPSPDIHRSPFGGGNVESYSEDPFLSGRIFSQTVKGCSKKGVYVFAGALGINSQKTRAEDNGLAVYCDEQTMRELYLRPFETCAKSGYRTVRYYERTDEVLGTYAERTTQIPLVTAIRTSVSRVGDVWAGGSYALISGLLRNEWGFDGYVLTSGSQNYMTVNQMLSAGGDALAGQTSLFYTPPTTKHFQMALRAVRNQLFNAVNTSFMNGYIHGITYVPGFPYYLIIVIGVNVLIGTLVVWILLRLIMRVGRSRTIKRR